ncbi:unnamed protein product [Lampetra planeri]
MRCLHCESQRERPEKPPRVRGGGRGGDDPAAVVDSADAAVDANRGAAAADDERTDADTADDDADDEAAAAAANDASATAAAADYDDDADDDDGDNAAAAVVTLLLLQPLPLLLLLTVLLLLLLPHRFTIEPSRALGGAQPSVRWQRCRSDAKRLERRPMQCDNALEERLVASRRAFSRTLHSRVEGRAMRLGTSELQCLFTDGLKAIAALISEHRHELRICGWRRAGLAERQTTSGHRLGHVRHPGTDEGDVLSGRRSHHRRKVHEQSVEITTLRVDVTTDGRHAEVEFTTDWQTDSDGTLYEYFNGMEDQKNKKVRFVGDPDKSIQEDYLRIVRYFRFYGSVHEPQTLAAIERDAGGRTGIAGERIWVELKKSLMGHHARPLFALIYELGVAPHT